MSWFIRLIYVLTYVQLAAAAAAWNQAVCLSECVNCNSAEAENDNRYENITDIGKSLLPFLVAKTDSLECAPETVAEVKTEGYEPYDVDCNHPPVLECEVEKNVRVFSVLSHELFELHVCPEVVEVECNEAKNYDSEEEHVLRCPRFCLALAA